MSWKRLVSVSMEPSTDLVGEFYGSMSPSLTMILLSFVSTLLTVCDRLEEQEGL